MLKNLNNLDWLSVFSLNEILQPEIAEFDESFYLQFC